MADNQPFSLWPQMTPMPLPNERTNDNDDDDGWNGCVDQADEDDDGAAVVAFSKVARERGREGKANKLTNGLSRVVPDRHFTIWKGDY